MTEQLKELQFNGPEIVSWLESTDADLSQNVIGNSAKALKRWREGEGAPLGTVDVICTKAGLHLSMVPDELWED